MKAYMMNGTIKEIDTSATVFDNQYITTDGDRIFDTEIKRIEDDIRLGDLYCCSKKQGTYEEVMKAIEEERSHINDCKNCFWYQAKGRVEEKCHSERTMEGDEQTIVQTTVYKYGCKWNSVVRSAKTCVHDICEKPRLFRDVNDCYFCNHPEGIPDQTEFIKFVIDNCDKYSIVSYWGNGEKLSYRTLHDDKTGNDFLDFSPFQHDKEFGSYRFYHSSYAKHFTLENARNKFYFIFDFKNMKYILIDGWHYRETNTFYVNHNPIANWDKFNAWFTEMVKDFIESQK